MILVPRAELLAWAKAWQDEYDPNDGADCVTPFDAYLLKPPVNAQSTVHVEVLRHMKGTIKAIMPSEVAALDAAIAALSAPQPPVEAHCATCSCVPGMTPAVRFDATPAEKEGAVREHLIRMGWTPPAEAQPVGVEGFRDWVIEQMPAGTVIDNPELWAERLARAYELNVPPPSAPVGAGEVDCRCVDCGGNQPGHDPTCSYMHELHGEQPAAAGEEIMVNAAHDVYTLPLQPSGLLSGPRFVVHVPAPEQPAAVDGAARRRDVRLWMRHNAGSYSTATELAEAADEVFRLPDGGLDNETHWVWDEAAEAVDDSQRGVLSVTDDGEYRTNPIQHPTAVDDLMNAWRAAFITERATRYREGGMKIEQARIHAETDATLMEKIARQSQGGEK